MIRSLDAEIGKASPLKNNDLAQRQERFGVFIWQGSPKVGSGFDGNQNFSDKRKVFHQ